MLIEMFKVKWFFFDEQMSNFRRLDAWNDSALSQTLKRALEAVYFQKVS